MFSIFQMTENERFCCVTYVCILNYNILVIFNNAVLCSCFVYMFIYILNIYSVFLYEGVFQVLMLSFRIVSAPCLVLDEKLSVKNRVYISAIRWLWASVHICTMIWLCFGFLCFITTWVVSIYRLMPAVTNSSICLVCRRLRVVGLNFCSQCVR